MCDEAAEQRPECEMGRLIKDVGQFLADDEPTAVEVGREAIRRGAVEVNELLHSAFAAHEIVATELRFTSLGRGDRRTVFADVPTPVGLLLLCLRLCDAGDGVAVLHHTAGMGTTTRSATWPFGMAEAEEITRPPSRPEAPLPGL